MEVDGDAAAVGTSSAAPTANGSGHHHGAPQHMPSAASVQQALASGWAEEQVHYMQLALAQAGGGGGGWVVGAEAEGCGGGGRGAGADAGRQPGPQAAPRLPDLHAK